MQERVIEFEAVNPVEIFGTENSNIDLLKSYFPKLRIIARGNTIKIMGSDVEMDRLELIVHSMYKFYQKYNQLHPKDIEAMIAEDGGQKPDEFDNAVILHGVHGEQIKARTPNQLEMVKQIATNDMMFALGPAGTGKTYTAVALAVRALKDREVKKIILTRPAVEAGENLGFLPGDLKEKLDPYLQPLYDALRDMVPSEKLAEYVDKGIIQIAPLAFMRGRTLDKAFVILDEAQNATESQLKMFLTRMGKSAKFIITGDRTQIDLPPKQKSGLIQAVVYLEGLEGIAFIHMKGTDVLRHRLVRKIIDRYQKFEEDPSNKSTKK